MYKKLAGVSPVSFGVFFAFFMLLTVIVIALIGYFILPSISASDGAPGITIMQPVLDPVVEMTQTADGLIQLAISAGFMLLGYFVIGVLLAILYNITALFTGGIKIHVEERGYYDN